MKGQSYIKIVIRSEWHILIKPAGFLNAGAMHYQGLIIHYKKVFFHTVKDILAFHFLMAGIGVRRYHYPGFIRTDVGNRKSKMGMFR